MGYIEEVTADAPIRWYRLGEAAGTTSVDAIAAANGTYAAGVTVAQAGALVGSADTAIALNGAAAASSAYPTPNLTRPFSLEAWVLLTAPGSVGSTTHSAWLGYAANRRILIENGVGARRVLTQMGSLNMSSEIDSFPLAAWHHIVYTCDASPLETLYLDGVLRAQQVPSGVAITSTGVTPTFNPAVSWFLGGYDQPASNYSWNGKIDEMAIYDKALTLPRVRAHYLTGLGLPAIQQSVLRSLDGSRYA